ncbi:MAG: isoprenyl transferase [Methyloligellaceae bacterium]
MSDKENKIDLLDGHTPPGHIAIIMDGNGRWAKNRGKLRSFGHRQGVQAVRRTVQACMELGVGHLTLYSFSSENWSRPADEVKDLMGLIKLFIKQDLAELHKHNVKIRIIGESERADSEIVKLMKETVELTKNNTGLDLTVAFSYGSRDEIVRAAKKIASKVKDGDLAPEDISHDLFEEHLDTSEVPDPDLLIRTSGEKRLSNFLLWQSAYTEFVFQDVLWPDYDENHLLAAIQEYFHRDRRYGGVAEKTIANK